jgi:uncharacterized protein (UPF0303 family)
VAEPQTIEELQAEAEELVLPAFDPTVAWEIGLHIRTRAMEAGMPIAFEVSRIGQPVFFHAMAGAVPDNGHWIRRKRAVVERFHRSSLLMKLLADRDGRPFLERYVLSAADYVASGGSVPLVVAGGGCIGAVTVSGLTQYDDHRLAVAAIRHVLAGTARRPAAGPTA